MKLIEGTSGATDDAVERIEAAFADINSVFDGVSSEFFRGMTFAEARQALATSLILAESDTTKMEPVTIVAPAYTRDLLEKLATFYGVVLTDYDARDHLKISVPPDTRCFIFTASPSKKPQLGLVKSNH